MRAAALLPARLQRSRYGEARCQCSMRRPLRPPRNATASTTKWWQHSNGRRKSTLSSALTTLTFAPRQRAVETQLQAQLACNKLTIHSAVREQRIVIATLHDTATIEHHNSISIAHGR